MWVSLPSLSFPCRNHHGLKRSLGSLFWAKTTTIIAAATTTAICRHCHCYQHNPSTLHTHHTYIPLLPPHTHTVQIPHTHRANTHSTHILPLNTHTTPNTHTTYTHAQPHIHILPPTYPITQHTHHTHSTHTAHVYYHHHYYIDTTSLHTHTSTHIHHAHYIYHPQHTHHIHTHIPLPVTLRL